MEENFITLLEKWKFVRKYHRALSNIMDCEEYDLSEALVLNNDNLSIDGRITYVPVYMVMFLEKKGVASIEYKIDLSVLATVGSVK